jgi:predicted nucleic acid-binding Zn ribbon protein
MAQYLYVCENEHVRVVVTSVFDTSAYFCNDCAAVMWRKPQQYGLSFKGSGFYSKEK